MENGIRFFVKIVLLVVFLQNLSLSGQVSPPAPKEKKVASSPFKSAQMQNKKVKEAYDTFWPEIQKQMKEKNINSAAFDVFLRAFKLEKKLEVWIKNKGDNKYQLFKTYDICATSGVLGPKRQEGDGQIPEGYYEIDLFNPNSDYYLSMRVNYPNSSDMILKTGANPGGAIMVHGKCVTIGCLPITDEGIKELYTLCVEAKNLKDRIYIDIFPCRFSEENMKMLQEKYPTNMEFWNNIKIGYDFFEANKSLMRVNVDKKGQYYFEKTASQK